MTSVFDHLRGIDLFGGLGTDQLQAIARSGEIHTAPKGEVVIHEDESQSRGLFIILEGEAKVILTGSDGREAVLAFLSEGEFFGEMSLLDGDPRSATVRASSDATLLFLKRDAFFDLLRAFPEIAIAMLAELSTRLRNANRRISALALSPVNARISGALLQLAELRGVRVHGQIIIRDRPTQQEIADMANTTRETVSRVLGQLHKDGMIATEGRDLLILQEDKLRGEP